MSSLKVVGLISGGKDSLFTLLHCVHHGHQIVALANLYPGIEAGKDSVQRPETGDIDSYMYQTVGHSIIPLYAKALNLPLYRRQIKGKAMQTAKEYKYISDSLDETEDLFSLLQEVKIHHPDVTAICSGAIFSNYQRTRVESIAVRLNLTPLSYLWQYPTLGRTAANSDSMTGLLDDMAAAGCEARIVKVASGGLDEKLLWADVCDPQIKRRLVRIMTRFIEVGSESDLSLKGAVLGEGGEYETLALRGPSSLWSYHILVDPEALVPVQGESGTSSLAIEKASLIPHATSQPSEQPTIQVPALLSATFSKIQSSFPFNYFPSMSAMVAGKFHVGDYFQSPISDSRVFYHALSNTLYICNLLPTNPNQLPIVQFQSIFDRLMQLLSTHEPPFSPHSILHTTIFLRDMNHFPLLNDLYAKLPLSDPLPPSRVTVSIGSMLPLGHELSMSFILSSKPSHAPRKGLHVQSRSYWAPCNIGPYSQAIAHRFSDSGELTYLAGQIPLVPATMTPLSDEAPFIQHALLALQHLWRVGRAMRVQWWIGGGVVFLARVAKGEDLVKRVRAVGWAWNCAHQRRSSESDMDREDGDGENDVWDQQFNRFQLSQDRSAGHQDEEKLPDWGVLERYVESDTVPPLAVVEVESLPRDVVVEWSSVGLSLHGQSKLRMFTEHGDRTLCITSQILPVGGTHPSTTTDVAMAFTEIMFSCNKKDCDVQTVDERWANLLQRLLDMDGIANAAHVTAYVPTSPESKSVAEAVEKTWPGRVLMIPCYSLWDGQNRKSILILSIRHERRL